VLPLDREGDDMESGKKAVMVLAILGLFLIGAVASPGSGESQVTKKIQVKPHFLFPGVRQEHRQGS